MSYLKLLIESWQAMSPDRRLRWGIAGAALLLVIVGLVTANSQIASLEKKRLARERDLKTMMVLKQQFLAARAGAQGLANRLAATRPDDSPAKIIEEIGIKGKSSKIAPLKSEDLGGYLADLAEVRVEGVTANEAINMLFRLEQGSKPVMIRRALLKSRFDDPARLDLTMTIGLLKAAPGGAR
jgi:general secretion pathway protein M